MGPEFRTIGYSDIDLDATERLLKEQGLLRVELGRFRAWTLNVLLNQERRLRTRPRSTVGRLWRRTAPLLELVYLFPLVVLSSKLVVLHCIYVNHCHHVEWERLPSGKRLFTLT